MYTTYGFIWIATALLSDACAELSVYELAGIISVSRQSASMIMQSSALNQQDKGT